MTPYDQSAYRVRLEWGPVGGVEVVDRHTYAVVADVLSFTTCVSVAVDRGLEVLPWRASSPDEDADTYADRHAAVRALGRDEAREHGGVSLSPASLRDAPPDLRRVVLPSPNGATTVVALAERCAGVVAGCLRNRTAVAGWLAERLAEGGAVALVPAGERWAADGSLRPAAEDLYGVGAVLEALLAAVPDLTASPEAVAALTAWRAAAGASADVAGALRATGSGRELVERGYATDVDIAAELDASDHVPVLTGTTFVSGSGGVRAL
ncbi:2-phosphosulfolactate phosphatase [Nocardioides sp. CFH 31398]|uniref:2-phosphosulfolactate phosphatase n=1 Tax=Nocardioides sp. CFH 31398 TaxID=2919579 RepID=UPI001F06EE2D|nr:2-phosphosulfolactate phosphatase [Nocardioides sp. CFH 31398]MCH1866485.1 2-phosphosulfolactate phosphatase [Nocardioides sp. CFH 31398]